MPARSPQKRGADQSSPRWTDKPAASLHSPDTEKAPPVRAGLSSVSIELAQSLPTRVESKPADSTPSRAVGFCVGWPNPSRNNSPASGSRAKLLSHRHQLGLPTLRPNPKKPNGNGLPFGKPAGSTPSHRIGCTARGAQKKPRPPGKAKRG